MQPGVKAEREAFPHHQLHPWLVHYGANTACEYPQGGRAPKNRPAQGDFSHGSEKYCKLSSVASVHM